MIRVLALAVVFTCALAARAEEPAGTPFIGGFADNSALPLFVSEGKLAIATKYGKLDVPFADIVRVEFGFRYPPGIEAKIAAAIEKLGDADFKIREEAQKQLNSVGETALPLLKKAAKGTNPELVRRADECIIKIQTGLPRDRGEIVEYDVIVTETSVLSGKLETASITVKTKFFGEKAIALGDLRTFRHATLDPEPKVKPATLPLNPNGIFAPPGVAVPPGGAAPLPVLPGGGR